MSNTNKKPFNAIRLCRLHADLTRDEAAKLMGIAKSSIIKYELNFAKPGINALQKMSVAYKCTIDELLKQ